MWVKCFYVSFRVILPRFNLIETLCHLLASLYGAHASCNQTLEYCLATRPVHFKSNIHTHTNTHTYVHK